MMCAVVLSLSCDTSTVGHGLKSSESRGIEDHFAKQGLLFCFVLNHCFVSDFSCVQRCCWLHRFNILLFV